MLMSGRFIVGVVSLVMVITGVECPSCSSVVAMVIDSIVGINMMLLF